MSTDTPTDQLAGSPEQELVLLASRAPSSVRFHRSSQADSAHPRCNGFQYDGQLVPRWYAVDELGRRPCETCFAEEVEA